MTGKQFKNLARQYAERCAREIGCGRVSEYGDGYSYEYVNPDNSFRITVSFRTNYGECRAHNPQARFDSATAAMGSVSEVTPYYQAVAKLCKIGNDFNEKHGKKAVYF